MSLFVPKNDEPVKDRINLNIFKRKTRSAYHDFKTGFFCKLFLFLGLIFLIFLIVQYLIPTVVDENTIGIIFAFVLLFFGLGFIFYFLSRQFAKLAKIAEEIENEE